MLMFIPTYGILLLMRFLAVITKYTVLDERQREAKEGKSQRQNPRSITRGANEKPTPLERSNDNVNLNVLISTPDKRSPVLKCHISDVKKVAS